MYARLYTKEKEYTMEEKVDLEPLKLSPEAKEVEELLENYAKNHTIPKTRAELDMEALSESSKDLTPEQRKAIRQAKFNKVWSNIQDRIAKMTEADKVAGEDSPNLSN